MSPRKTCPDCHRALRGYYCAECEITWDADELAAPDAPAGASEIVSGSTDEVPAALTTAQRRELFDD
jgi:NMD protein affecting ribosome stability and mRNA decay